MNIANLGDEDLGGFWGGAGQAIEQDTNVRATRAVASRHDHANVQALNRLRQDQAWR